MKAPEVVRQNEGVRVVARTAAQLLQEGLEEGEEYAGGKWGGLYLRAPDIFFRVLEKAGDKLVRLGDVAEVRRGFTTGANEFFYLEPLDLSVKEVIQLREQNPMAPVRVRNGAGWEGEIEAAWLRPVVKSPREVKTLQVRLEDLSYLAFVPPEDVRQVIDQGGIPGLDSYPRSVGYIRWGEEHSYHLRSTCASRTFWWDLGARGLPNIVWVKSVHDNHRQGLLPFAALVDQRLYELQNDEPKPLVALLNSSVLFLAKELTSRANLGEGALDTSVYEANNTLIINHTFLPPSSKERLVRAFDLLAHRPVRSFFEELGFSLCRYRSCRHSEHPYEHVHPESLTLEQVKEASPDRFELDRAVFDILGLTDEERLEVYRAVVQLVKSRLVRARTRQEQDG